MRTSTLSYKALITSRKSNASAVAKSAYMDRDRVRDERLGIVHDYTPAAQEAALMSAAGKSVDGHGVTISAAEVKDDLVYSATLAPPDAPDWARDAKQLWNRAELHEDTWADKYYVRTPARAERHKERASVAISGNFSLLRESSIEEAIEVTREVALKKFVCNGQAVQVAVHWRDGQPHAHFLATTRTVGAKGFGTYATWSDRQRGARRKGENAIQNLHPGAKALWHIETRRIIAEAVNGAAIERGHEVRVEHRSFRDQDIAFLQELPVGPGQSTARAALNAERAEANAELAMSDPGQLAREVFANSAVTTEANLKRAVLRRCPDDAAFQTAWKGLIEEGHVVEIGRDPRGRVVYSAPHYIQNEQALLEAGIELAGWNKIDDEKERARLEAIIGTYEADKGFRLKDEQRTAISLALFGGDLTLVQGLPGTGKTTAMEVVRRYYDAKSAEMSAAGNEPQMRVRGAAIAAVAAKNLERESGIKSTTVAKIVHDYKVAQTAEAVLADEGALPREKARALIDLEKAKGTHLRHGDTLIIDEAGMVPVEDMALLFAKAKELNEQRNGTAIEGGPLPVRIALVGDHEQIASVGAGSAFRALFERHPEVTTVLQEISRQKDKGDLAASHAFVRGDIEAAVMHYHAKGYVHFAQTKEQGIKDIVARAMELRDRYGPAEVLVTANLNRDIDAINEQVREIRKQRGELGPEHKAFGINLAVNDEVMVQENNTRLGLVSGSIKAIGFDNGERALVRAVMLDLQGKVSSVVLEKVGHDGKPDGRQIHVAASDPLRIRHSYAITSHKSQGQTRDRVLHYAGNESRTLGLVSATRHRHHYEIFADSETYKNDLRDLIRETASEGRQENARDYNVTPERQRFFEAVERYASVSATYNVACVKEPRNTGKLAGLAAERRAAAALIVGSAGMSQEERDRTWDAHRQFAAQARLDRWSLEETAGVRERLMSLREQRAERLAGNFLRLHSEANSLWGEIKRTHGKAPHEHRDYARFAALVIVRGREASIMAADRKLYAPLVERDGVTWASVRSIATRHRDYERQERLENGVDAEALARFEKIAAEVSKVAKGRPTPSRREELEELRSEAKRLAVELYDVGFRREDLPAEAKAARSLFHTYTHAVRTTEKPGVERRIEIEAARKQQQQEQGVMSQADIAAVAAGHIPPALADEVIRAGGPAKWLDEVRRRDARVLFGELEAEVQPVQEPERGNRGGTREPKVEREPTGPSAGSEGSSRGPEPEAAEAGRGPATAPEIDAEAIRDRLSPDTLAVLEGGRDTGPRHEARVVRALAAEGLTLEESVAVSERFGGDWKRMFEQRQYRHNTGWTLAQDYAAMWDKFGFEERYGTQRDRFHDVPAEREMEDAVYKRLPEGSYVDMRQAWIDQEAAAQDVGDRAGVEIPVKPVPERPQEKLVERSEELVQAVKGATVRAPLEPSYVAPAAQQEAGRVREAEAMRAARVGKLSERDIKEDSRPVAMRKEVWAGKLIAERNAREERQARVAPTDLPPRLAAIHAKAVEASRMQYWDYARIAGRAQHREAILNAVFSRTANAVNTEQKLSPLQLKQAAFREEMKRYDKAISVPGVSAAERRELLAREAKQKAAEMGLDLELARSGLAPSQRRALIQFERHETRVAKKAEAIEVARGKTMREMPAREVADLTPAERKAHTAALERLDMKPVDLRQVVGDLERGRAADEAKPGQSLSAARNRTAMSTDEMKTTLLKEETKVYKSVLAAEGVAPERVEKLGQREEHYRATALGLADREVHRKTLETVYGAGAHDAHRDRIDGLARDIVGGRAEAPTRLEQYELTETERAAHSRALAASRFNETEVAGLVRDHEVNAVRAGIGDVEGRSFYDQWEQEKLAPEEARKLIMEAELSRYADALREEGVGEGSMNRMIEAERIQRAAELKVTDREGRDRNAREIGLGDEDAATRYRRYDQLALAVMNREPGVSSVDRASRLNENEVKRLAGEMEFAAREAYKTEHCVTLAQAARSVRLSSEELRAGVEAVESARAEELRLAAAREVQVLAEQRDMKHEHAEKRELDDKVQRFVQVSRMIDELDPSHDAPRRAELAQEAKRQAAEIRQDERFEEEKTRITTRIKGYDPEIGQRFERYDREASRPPGREVEYALER